MAHFSNYIISNTKPYLNLLQRKYDLDLIHPYVKNRKVYSNNIHSNYSLFNNDFQKSNQTNNYNNNGHINYNDLGSFMNVPLSYENNKEKKYTSKSSEQDIDVMKLQLRCDLIGQKINQIKNQIQNFDKSNSKDDKKILKKNRTYGNFNKNQNFSNSKTSEYIKDYEKKNFFKIPIPIKKDTGLNDGFRKKKNRNKLHNISYISKNISNNYFLKDNIDKKEKIHENNCGQSSFFNSNNNSNQKEYIIANNQKGYKKIIINKINSNPNKIIEIDNNANKYNNYINDYYAKYNLVPNSIDRINKKTYNKGQILRKNLSAQRIKSNNVSPNKNNIIIKNRKKNGINDNFDFEKKSKSVAKYGSFDQYFLSDNNYTDKSYIKYIDTIKNNFNSINLINLDKIKENSFNNSKIVESKQIKQNNLIIQKGNNVNIINVQDGKLSKKDMNKACYYINKNKEIKNINNSTHKKNLNSAKIRNKNNKIDDNIKTNNELKNRKTQINNNFNVNNNTNYYNFNYNQNNNKNYMDKFNFLKKKKNNSIKGKMNDINNKNKTQNEIFNDNIEEYSINDYVKFNHDYSNDELIHTSDMFNSINDNNTNSELLTKKIYYQKQKIKQI